MMGRLQLREKERGGGGWWRGGGEDGDVDADGDGGGGRGKGGGGVIEVAKGRVGQVRGVGDVGSEGWERRWGRWRGLCEKCWRVERRVGALEGERVGVGVRSRVQECGHP